MKRGKIAKEKKRKEKRREEREEEKEKVRSVGCHRHPSSSCSAGCSSPCEASNRFVSLM